MAIPNSLSHLDDSALERDRSGRAVVAAAIGLGVLSLLWGSWGTFGFILALIVLAFMSTLFLANVKAHQGAVYQNRFTGKLLVYGPGLHFKFPWEFRDKAFNLTDVSSEFKAIPIPTVTDEVTVDVSWQWRPSLPNLATFRMMEELVQKGGFFEPVQRFLATAFSAMAPEEVLAKRTVLNDLIMLAVAGNVDAAAQMIKDQGLKPSLLDDLKSVRTTAGNLPESYGIQVTQVNITSINFSEAVMKARAAVAAQLPLLEVAYMLAGGKDSYDRLPPDAKERLREETRVMGDRASERTYRFR